MPAEKCWDCGVPPGTQHEDGCDIATCLWTGWQRLACRGIGPYLKSMLARGVLRDPQFWSYESPDHDCGRDVWSGEPHGWAQCRRWKLFVRQPPDGPLVRCEPDHPDALHDMNTLMRCGVWDRDRCEWVLLDGPV